MRKHVRVWLLLLAINYTSDVQACDVCGSSISNQSLGLLPQFSKHFVGLQYMYASSESSHPSLFADKPNEESNQKYINAQVWGRYQISKRLQGFGFLPYIGNVTKDATQVNRANGIGDASLMLNYAIPLPEKANSKQILLGGIGLKMPTGQYSSSNAERNTLPNSQAGSGSWDFLGNINYTQKGKKWGYNLDASYVLTTANKWGYKYGNRLNTTVQTFYWVEQKQFKVVPQIGLRIEHALHDYDNYSKKWLNEKTGGVMSFSTVGTQVLYKKVGIKAILSIPIYQQYAAGYVRTNTRFESGVFLLF
jgi:hypothetical protein